MVKNKLRFISLVLAIIVMFSSVQLKKAHAQDVLTTDVTCPFGSDITFNVEGVTVTSNSYRIPSMVTLADGTMVAAADIRWNTTYDGGCLDTLVARSSDGGVTWDYTVANYLGDNGNTYDYNSTAFIDPCLTVAKDGKTVYMLCDLYSYGVALNGLWQTDQIPYFTFPSTDVGFNEEGYLKLSNDNHESYGYYLKEGKIFSNIHEEVSGYIVDEYFNITYMNDGKVVTSNLFYADSPYKVVRTGYLYLTSTGDGGKTWSEPTLLNLKTDYEQVCLSAPGCGITVSDGTMVFPVYSYNGSSESQKMGFVYSKDDGKTWARVDSNVSWSSESAVVEIGRGILRFFYRNGNSVLCYVDYDMRTNSWGSEVITPVDTNSNTQLSAITYSETLDGKQVVLVSSPTGPNGEGSNQSNGAYRLNGKIFAFTIENDGSMTLVSTKNVTETIASVALSGSDYMEAQGFFSYSCLTERADGSVAILYENNQYGWGSGDGKYYTMNMKAYVASDFGLTFDSDETPSDVTVAGGIPDDAMLNVKEITDETELDGVFSAIGKALYPNESEEYQVLSLNREYRVLDISFLKGDEKVQPDKAVTISVDVNDLDVVEGDKCIIYHLHENGSVDVLTATVKDDKVTFAVDNFSIFVLATNEAAIYNVKTFYNVDSENISGNGQFYAAGIYFTDNDETHVLIGGSFNVKQADKIIEVSLNDETILTMDKKTYLNYITPTADIGKLFLYDGANETSDVIYCYDVNADTDWLDINLGSNITIDETFKIGVKTSTAGGTEGNAFNLGIHVVAQLEYDIVKTVYKVGNTVYNTKTASGSTGKEVIFKIETQNTGEVEIIGAEIAESMPANIFDLSTIAYSMDLNSWIFVNIGDSSACATDFTIDVGTLSAGEMKTYYVKATVLDANVADGTYINNVKLSANNQDIAAEDEASIVISSSCNIEKVVDAVNENTPVASDSESSASKSAKVKSGDTVIYKITINNTGDNALSDITITDELPRGAYTGDVFCGESVDGLSSVQILMNRFTIAENVSISAGASVVYYVKITIPSDILGGTYANTAAMSVTINNETITLQDSANIVVPVVLNQSITKEVFSVNDNLVASDVSVPQVYLDDTVVYEITVANDGNAALEGTCIKDTLPVGMYDAQKVYYRSSDTNNWMITSVTDGVITFPVGEQGDNGYSMKAGKSYTYYVKLNVSSNAIDGRYTNTAALFTTKELCKASADVDLIIMTTLTIEKAGYSDYETIDPNQTFLFRVTGEDVDLTVTVHGEGSITITDLKVGETYIVTELSDWSWRYGLDNWSFTTAEDTATFGKDNGAQIVLGASGNEIVFTNKRENIYWLDGDNYRVNIFNGTASITD